MTFETITDHVAQAKERQVQRWKGLTNEDKIIKIRVARLQIIEGTLNEMINQRAISTSDGVQLDGIGEFYGDQGDRNGRTDDEYKAFLQIIPALLRQAGQVDVLIDSLSLLTSREVSLLQSFPRVVLMHVFSDAFDDFGDHDLIRSSMEEIKASGVKLEIGAQLNSTAFIFSDSVSGGNAGEGFASTSAQTDGGNFVKLLGED